MLNHSRLVQLEERSAVNREVLGSSPRPGAKILQIKETTYSYIRCKEQNDFSLSS